MRSLIVLLLLTAFALLANWEWRRAGHDLDSLTLTDFSGPMPSPATTPSQLAGQAAVATPDLHLARIAELQKKTAEAQAKVDAVDQQERETADNSERALADSSDRLRDAQHALAALRDQRAYLIQQRMQSLLEQRTRREENQIESEVLAAQLKERLTREQALSQQLDQKLKALRAINISTDELKALESAAPAQAQTVATLEAQYRDFEFDNGRSRAQALAQKSLESSSIGPEDLQALDSQISTQSQLVSTLEQQQTQEQKR